MMKLSSKGQRGWRRIVWYPLHIEFYRSLYFGAGSNWNIFNGIDLLYLDQLGLV